MKREIKLLALSAIWCVSAAFAAGEPMIRTKVSEGGELEDASFGTFDEAFQKTANGVVSYIGSEDINVDKISVPAGMTLTGEKGCGNIYVSNLTIGEDAVVDVPSMVDPSTLDNRGTFVINKYPSWLDVVGQLGHYVVNGVHTDQNGFTIPVGSDVVGVADSTSSNGVRSTLTLASGKSLTGSNLYFRGVSLDIKGDVDLTDTLILYQGSKITIDGTLRCRGIWAKENSVLTLNGDLLVYQLSPMGMTFDETGVVRSKTRLGASWKIRQSGFVLEEVHSEEDGYWTYFIVPAKVRAFNEYYRTIEDAYAAGETDVTLLRDDTLAGATFGVIFDGEASYCNYLRGDGATLTLTAPLVIEDDTFSYVPVRSSLDGIKIAASADFQGETMISVGGIIEDWSVELSASNAPAVKTILAVSGHNTRSGYSDWFTYGETTVTILGNKDQTAIDIVDDNAKFVIGRGSKVTGIIGYHASGELRIDGGEYDVTWDVDPSIPPERRSISITGGVFTKPVPDELLPSGYVSVLGEDGRYVVKNPDYPFWNVTKQTSHRNIMDALEASVSGDTILLTRDYTDTRAAVRINYRDNVVVDLGGHVLAFTMPGSDVSSEMAGCDPSCTPISATGTLVISNGVIAVGSPHWAAMDSLVGIMDDRVLHDVTVDMRSSPSFKACVVVDSYAKLRLRGRTKILAPVGMDAIIFERSDTVLAECEETCRFSSRIPSLRCPEGYVPCRYGDCPEAPYGVRKATAADLSDDLLPPVDAQEEGAVERIAEILSVAADGRLGERISTPQAYGDFRDWVIACGFDARAVLDSPAAYADWRLGLDAVTDWEPVITLEGPMPFADRTGASFRLRVRNGSNTLAVDAAKVRSLIQYTHALGPDAVEWLPVDEKDCVASPNEDGTVGLEVRLSEPADAAFFRLSE